MLENVAVYGLKLEIGKEKFGRPACADRDEIR